MRITFPPPPPSEDHCHRCGARGVFVNLTLAGSVYYCRNCHRSYYGGISG
jgi:transposase